MRFSSRWRAVVVVVLCAVVVLPQPGSAGGGVETEVWGGHAFCGKDPLGLQPVAATNPKVLVTRSSGTLSLGVTLSQYDARTPANVVDTRPLVPPDSCTAQVMLTGPLTTYDLPTGRAGAQVTEQTSTPCSIAPPSRGEACVTEATASWSMNYPDTVAIEIPYVITVNGAVRAEGTVFIGDPSVPGASRHESRLPDGEALLRGLFFPSGAGRAEFREIWERVIPPAVALPDEIKARTGRFENAIIGKIAAYDPGFLARFEREIRSGEHLRIDAALEEAAGATLRGFLHEVTGTDPGASVLTRAFTQADPRAGVVIDVILLDPGLKDALPALSVLVAETSDVFAYRETFAIVAREEAVIWISAAIGPGGEGLMGASSAENLLRREILVSELAERFGRGAPLRAGVA